MAKCSNPKCTCENCQCGDNCQCDGTNCKCGEKCQSDKSCKCKEKESHLNDSYTYTCSGCFI